MACPLDRRVQGGDCACRRPLLGLREALVSMSKGMEWKKKYKDIAGAPGLSREKWNKIYPVWFVECVWPVVANFLKRNRDRIGRGHPAPSGPPI